MKKKENKKARNDFEDGTDSGSVPEKTKVNLFAKQLGICAAPECDNRIHVDKTRLGECAHIIPRKVGSHPREDYETPLEDRKLESNLLYLCESHHKFIDNKELAYKYPVSVLQQWKEDHEQWASQVKKKTAYLPVALQEKLQDAIEQIGQGAEHSNELVSGLLEACREKIAFGRYQEANILFSQVELLLVDFSDPAFIERTKVIEALLDYRFEDVHLAKSKLLNVIENNTEAYDAMFEYIDVCEAAPEPEDTAEHYEKIVREIYPDHPRLEMLDALRAYRSEDKAKENAKKIVPTFEDNLLKLRFLIQKAIVFDVAGDVSSRDGLLGVALKEFPHSPRPHLFNFIFNAVDTLRSKPPKEKLKSCLTFSSEQKESAQTKGEITERDLLAWNYHSLIIKGELFRQYGLDEDINQTSEEVVKLLLKCFPDRNILSILFDVLHRVHLPKEEYIKLLCILETSRVHKSNELLQQIFIQGIQYEDLYEKAMSFFDNQKNGVLSKLIKDMELRDVKAASETLNGIASNEFTLAFINLFPDRDFALELSSNIEISEIASLDYNFARVGLLAEAGQPEEALKLMASLDISQLTPIALHKLADISYEHQAWPLFILVGEQLLPSLDSEKHKTDLLAQLGICYYKEEDDSKAVEHCEKALEKHEVLLPQNVKSLMWACSDCYSRLGKPDEAYEVFKRFGIEPTFELRVMEAQCVLKTSKQDKHQLAKECLLEAFIRSENYDDRVFVSAFVAVNEVGKSPEQLGMDKVSQGAYIKLDGIGWLFLGAKEKAMGATSIETGESYDALIDQSLGAEISWPADKFSSPGITRKITHILTDIGYLTARSQEGLDNLARLGTEPIWTVQALKEDGTLDVDNLTDFLKDKFKKSNEFFEQYISNVLPFSFLATVEGDIAKAIAKISNEEKGYIRCNDGSSEEIRRQSEVAKRVLAGESCVLDGLSAVMLAEAGLMEQVVKQVPHLCVPVSVISYLRKLASDMDPTTSSEGRGGLVGGKLHFTPKSENRESNFYTKLLAAAETLDKLDNKTIGRLIREEDKDGLLNALPPSLSEPVHIASEKNSCLLADDFFLLKAYERSEQKSLEGFSSLSLVKELHSNGHVSLKEYLSFFSLLAGYRYHLLPISVGEMIDAVLPKSSSGIVSFEPKNIEYLRLGLTLSPDYGVDETVSLRILSLFFAELIKDDTVTEDICDTIFAYTIVRYFGRRESFTHSEVIKKVVAKKIGDPDWLSVLSKKKYAILVQQLDKFSETYDPMFESIPMLLKAVRS